MDMEPIKMIKHGPAKDGKEHNAPRRPKYIFPTALLKIVLEMSKNVYNVPECFCKF